MSSLEMIEKDSGSYQDIVTGMEEISKYIDGWSGTLAIIFQHPNIYKATNKAVIGSDRRMW